MRKPLTTIIEWFNDAPAGTMIPVERVREILAELGSPTLVAPVDMVTPGALSTWREKLWQIPNETRLNVSDVAEAFGRSKNWVYRHTSVRAGASTLPHRKLDGELVFMVGELKEWLADNERIIVRAARSLSLNGDDARSHGRRRGRGA